jgi:hypothetical protein
MSLKFVGTYPHVSYRSLQEFIGECLGRKPGIIIANEFNNDCSYGPFGPDVWGDEDDIIEAVAAWLAVDLPDPDDEQYVGENAWRYQLDVRDVLDEKEPNLYDLVAYLYLRGHLSEDTPPFYLDVSW